MSPWTVHQTWLLLGVLAVLIGLPTYLALRWQRRKQTPVERHWADDWWFKYRHHFEDDEGEAFDGGDAA